MHKFVSSPQQAHILPVMSHHDPQKHIFISWFLHLFSYSNVLCQDLQRGNFGFLFYHATISKFYLALKGFASPEKMSVFVNDAKKILHKKDLCERKCLCRRIMVNLFCSKIAGAKLFVSWYCKTSKLYFNELKEHKGIFGSISGSDQPKKEQQFLDKKSYLETVKRYGPNQKECSN